jgi:curved DNA-binding protein CbpA
MARGAGQEQDWYAILGIDPSAGPGDVKAAHRRLAKHWHPDMNSSPGAHDRMIELNHAREVLLDPAARAAYDLSHRRRVQQEAARAPAEATETPVRTVRIRAKAPAPRPPPWTSREDEPGPPAVSRQSKRDATGIYHAEPDFDRDWYGFLGVTQEATDKEIRSALGRKAIAMQIPGISAVEVSRRAAELRTARATIGTAAARAAYRRARGGSQ